MRRGLRFTPSGENEGAAWLIKICGASFVRLHPAGCSSGCSPGTNPAGRGHKMRLAPSGGTVAGRKTTLRKGRSQTPLAAATAAAFTTDPHPDTPCGLLR
jgi:hypothetical protein